MVVELKELLRLRLENVAVAVVYDYEKVVLDVGERESNVLDVEAFLHRGHLFRKCDLLGLHTVEGVPEADDVVDRASDELVLLVDVQRHHISGV